jgi:hypothetical protein
MGVVFNYAGGKHQNPAKLWGGLIVPADGEFLTIGADGDPDATENPNRVLLGTTEGGVVTRLNKEAEDEFVDEFATPVGQNVTVRQGIMSADFNQIIDIDVLEVLADGIGTVITEVGKAGVTWGTTSDSVFSIAAISPRSNDSTKFVVSHLYNVNVRVALELLMSRTQRMHSPTEFVGTPIASRAAVDQIGAFWWETA